jgi:hypothetical protein
MFLSEIGLECKNRINRALDRDRCRDLVNTVTKLLVPQKAGHLLTS